MSARNPWYSNTPDNGPHETNEPAGTQSAGGLCHATNQIAGGIQPRRQSLPTCTKSPKKSSLLVQSPATPQTKKRLPPRPRGPLYRRRLQALRTRSGLLTFKTVAIGCSWSGNGVAETIIPEAKEHFLTPSARRDAHFFGGLGFTDIQTPYLDQVFVRLGRDTPALSRTQ